MAAKIDAEDARQFGFNPENLATSAFVGVAVLSGELGIMGVLGDISSFHLLVSIAKMLSGWNPPEISDIQDIQLSRPNPAIRM